MTPFFQLDPRIESASAAALQQVAPRFTEIDEVTEYNQLKVLRAFMDNGISERHFGSSTGYGYGDEGREKRAIPVPPASDRLHNTIRINQHVPLRW